MPKDYTEIREQIDELLDVGNLSRWESNFLTSVASQLDRDWGLTDEQEAKLREIIEAKL